MLGSGSLAVARSLTHDLLPTAAYLLTFAGKKQDVSFCTWRSERPVASQGAALSCVAPSVVRGPSVVTAPRCASRPLMRLAGFSGLNFRKGTFCLKPLRPQNECQRMIRTQMPVWTPVANHGSSRWQSCSSTSRRGGAGGSALSFELRVRKNCWMEKHRHWSLRGCS